MLKSDLKNWMIVENRIGKRYVVLFDKIISDGEYDNLFNYSTDLKNVVSAELDIVRIYELKSADSIYDITHILDVDNADLIWERTTEIDWTKVPKWTKVQITDSLAAPWKNAYFLGLETEESVMYPFVVSFCSEYTYVDECDEDCFALCRLCPDVEPKEEWIK